MTAIHTFAKLFMKKLILKLIPNSIITKLFDGAKNSYKEYWKNSNNHLPNPELETKHVQNAKLLCNRMELLKLMPKNGVAVELGVDQGLFTEKILELANPSKLHLVDVWNTEVYNDDKRVSVQDKFKEHIESGKIELNIGYSTDVSKQFEDNYFDWIYIDTDHSYETTKSELEMYRTKVKPGGIIAGHDYILGSWNHMIRYGVKEAVHEFCLNHDWEIVYLTTEFSNFPSFAIRRIQ